MQQEPALLDSNIKTTDYFLLKNSMATAVGGHNLHRGELLFRPSRSSDLTVRRDPGTDQYIVDVPERLLDRLDMPKVVQDLNRRDLRQVTEPQVLPIPLRDAPSLAALVGRTSNLQVPTGATPSKMPRNTLFAGYGWRSEIGRLTQPEFERQLAIAESDSYDLIIKSIGGDMAIYRRIPRPPGRA